MFYLIQKEQVYKKEGEVQGNPMYLESYSAGRNWRW